MRIWELDHKEGKAPKNRCFQTVVLEKTLENPLDYMGIQPVHPKGNQPWRFIRRTDAKAPIVCWPLDLRTDSLEKTLMLAKIEGRSRRGWQRMRWLEGIIDSTDMGLSKLQEPVKHREACLCCSPQGHKELDTTERLNTTSIICQNPKEKIHATREI